MIPIERPNGVRADEMTASRMSDLRRSVAQSQEQHREPLLPTAPIA